MINLNGNEKILIVRLTAFGDCIHTLPLAYALKNAYPDIKIGWAVSEKCKQVIINNPLIDMVHVIPKNNKKLYFEKIKEIRNEKYDIAIDSQELLKSAFISFLSGAKYRLSHDKTREFSHFFANKRLKKIPIFDCSRHVIERNMDFARFLGVKNPQIDFVLPENNLDDLTYVANLLENIDTKKKTVIIAPSTTWITKFLPVETWISILSELNNKVNLIISGGNNDKKYVDKILSFLPELNVINCTGKTNMQQLKILFENADMVITPDSGSAHLASAVKNPVVITLFCSTSNVRNAAYGEKNINISLGLSCQPCYKKVCKFTKNIPVCANIDADIILEKVKALLKDE